MNYVLIGVMTAIALLMILSINFREGNHPEAWGLLGMIIGAFCTSLSPNAHRNTTTNTDVPVGEPIERTAPSGGSGVTANRPPPPPDVSNFPNPAAPRKM